MTLKGAIGNIVFFNAENGYTVFQLISDSDGGETTCVGYLPQLNVGQQIEVSGKIVTHQKFGEQFSVEKFSLAAPTGSEGLVRYLASGLIKGVGEATARLIVNSFGDDTLSVLENSPERLAELRGISLKKARAIGEEFNGHRAMQEQIMFLQSYDITLNTAIKIYRVYKDKTESVLKSNPYRLIDDVDGIGFLSADRIAGSMGIGKDSEFRLRAGIVYCLKDGAEKSGNTVIEEQTLKKSVGELLGYDVSERAELYEETVDNLIFDLMARRFEDGEKAGLALTRYYNIEKNIAGALVRLDEEAPAISASFKTLIEDFQSANGVKLHSNQRRAVEAAFENGVTVITGGPGTGKTTIVRCVSYICDALDIKAEYCCPTGRAAKRLGASTGKNAKTIHRLLGMEAREDRLVFAYDASNPLEADLVVVDEASMADAVIFNSLLKALRRGCRLVLVGDKDQLPSVGAGNVLADVIKSRLFSVNELTHIYRQSEDSYIVTNAHLINSGKMPVIEKDSKDFFFIARDNQEDILNEVTGLVTTRLPKFTSLSPAEIQVLAPMKSGLAGVANLNRTLQAKLNPFERSKSEINVGGVVFRTGDKVMQTVNDYNMEWEINDSEGVRSGKGVFNGDIGYITRIDRTENLAEILFDDGRRAVYTSADMPDLTLAYAVTVHKSQGSEFDALVVAVTNGPPTILNRNLLYTAVTRAKNRGFGMQQKDAGNDGQKQLYRGARHHAQSVFEGRKTEALGALPVRSAKSRKRPRQRDCRAFSARTDIPAYAAARTFSTRRAFADSACPSLNSTTATSADAAGLLSATWTTVSAPPAKGSTACFSTARLRLLCIRGK